MSFKSVGFVLCWYNILLASSVMTLLFPNFGSLYSMPNRCRMTYMYQYPDYIVNHLLRADRSTIYWQIFQPVRLNKTTRSQYPFYGLFIYGEGYYADGLRYQVLICTYYRNRIVRYTLVAASSTDFPFFLFMEMLEALCKELSAFSSTYLERQTKFVASCIEKIFSIYRQNGLNFSKITLIGHSQGGIVARYLMASKLIESDAISAIYELAAPISKPAITTDRNMVKIYDVIRRFEGNNLINQVSIGGGFNDLQVNQHLNNFPLDSTLHISTFASSLPQVWATADHLCIVWCNQLVRLIVRSIFNIYLDSKTLVSRSDIAKILSYHFVNNDGLKDFLVGKSNIDQRPKINLSIPFELTDDKSLFLSTTSNASIYRLCHNKSIILRTTILRRSKFLTFYNEGADSHRTLEHINFYILPDNSKIYFLPAVWERQCLVLDFSDNFKQDDYLLMSDESKAQNMEVTMGNSVYWEYSVVINASRSHFARLKLNNFYSIIQLYRFDIVTIDCLSGYARRIIASAVFNLSSSKERILYGAFRYPYNETDFMYLTLTSLSTNDSVQPELHLFLNPSCTYRLKFSSCPVLSVVQALRRYYEDIAVLCIQISFLYYIYGNSPASYRQSLTMVAILMMVSLRKIYFVLDFLVVIALSSLINVITYAVVRWSVSVISSITFEPVGIMNNGTSVCRLIGFTILSLSCALLSGSFGFILIYLLFASNESISRWNEWKSSLLPVSLLWLSILGFPTLLVRLITIRSSIFYYSHDWSLTALLISPVSTLIGCLSLRYFVLAYWLLWTGLFYYLCCVEYLCDLIIVLAVGAGLVFSVDVRRAKS